jgi:preprotein translocase subunit SecD
MQITQKHLEKDIEHRRNKPLTVIAAVAILVVIIPLLFTLYNKLNVPDSDKAGGYSILCELISEEQPDDSTINEVCAVLQKRIDPTGKYGLLIRHHKNQQIKICVPVRKKTPSHLDNPEHLQRMLKGAGVLEFRILPQVSSNALSRAEIDYFVKSLSSKGPQYASTSEYKWFEMEDQETQSVNQWANPQGGMAAIVGQFSGKSYVLASSLPGETLLHTPSQNDWKLERAQPSTDRMGRRAISFTLNDKGAVKFADLTGNNLERPLCILLDDIAISAPNISSKIAKSGVITGLFTYTEVADMVNKLNAGCLPVPVQEIPKTIEWILPKAQ